jgi:hypothetical protein
VIIVAAEKTIVIDSLAINVRWVAGVFTPVSKESSDPSQQCSGAGRHED